MTTPSGAQLRRRYRQTTFAVGLASLVCFGLSAWLAGDWAGARAYDDLRAAARESLSLQIEALTGMLEKYRLLPAVLSKRTEIRAIFREEDRSPDEVRDLLMEVTTASSAADVLIADPAGRVLVSARGLLGSDTIVNSPLPMAVEQHRLGRAALRLNDGSRAYAFASRIADPATGENVGMIVVLAPFTPIEANWSLSRNPIFVTDARELIFLSNRLEWSGQPWQASAGDHAGEPLSARAGDLVRVRERGGANYVEVARTLPILGWTMHVLADSAPIEVARRDAAAVAGLAVILVGLSAYLLVARQEMNRSRMRREKAQSMRLERLVRGRTAELSEVNEALRNEIEVRRQTEQQLRDTQDELVHAAKLAVIGQMSATLSHEYNQPLAAIKTYAGNAATMLAKGKTAALGDALSRIEQMVDRMNVLSKTLLAFSRKPGTTLYPATIDSIVSEALLIVGQKARQAGVGVRVDIAPEVTALTGRIRLSQVVVNLVSNAVDAMRGDGELAPAGAQVTISARTESDRVILEIADNGPGIDAELRSKIFDPFFTTKPVGSGLGLGLSIVDSIVRDLHGTVRVREGEDRAGACFVIDLPAAEPQLRAAE